MDKKLQEYAFQVLIRYLRADYKIPYEFVMTLENCIHIEFEYDKKWYATDIYPNQITIPFEIK